MSKPSVFVSCGQYLPSEKQLGKDIVDLVKKTTGHEAFFAEQVHDFNGLRDNILQAIQGCVGFIAVMHPRGEIDRPDGAPVIRASVWIEQEIAIAAYIQYVERRTLPVIAFIHESVCLEGIRSLLHLNPIPFKHESEVLAALPAHLQSWKTTATGAIRVELESNSTRQQDEHRQYQIEVYLVNDTTRRIDKYDARLRLPARVLKHWTVTYVNEVEKGNPSVRKFHFDQSNTGRPLLPKSGRNRVASIEYCLTCGQEDAKASTGFVDPVFDDIVEATVWVDEQEHSSKKTLRELHDDPLRKVYSKILSLE
jgi:hypothetical protein